MGKVCALRIKSIVDGQENIFSLDGKIEKSEKDIKLFYREEESESQVTFQDGKAWVDREGEYSLKLPLIEGLITQGTLGINGNSGNLDIFTHCIEYSLLNGKLSARLRYDILLGENAQEMELLIQADVQV